MSLRPVREPSRLLFRSSPRTSALAVGERETALGSPPCGHRAHTYTHTPFSQRPGITWTFPLPFPVFPFGRPNPKYPPPDHPGGAGSKPIGRKPITHTKAPFSQFLFVCFVPTTHRTHTCNRFPFHSGYHDCPVLTVHLPCCVFSITVSEFKVQSNSVLRIRISRIYFL